MSSGGGEGELGASGEADGKTSSPVAGENDGASKAGTDPSTGEGITPASNNEEGSKKNPSSENLSSPSQSGYQEQEQQQTSAFQHVAHPQQTMGYYYQQGTPPPPSPTINAPGANGYDIHAMLMQQAVMAGNPFASQQYSPSIPPPPPLSPSQSSANNNGAGSSAPNAAHLASPSPLMSPVAYPSNPFDQLDSSTVSRMGNISIGAPLSPALSYLPPQAVPNSPITGFTGIYQGSQISPESSSKWVERPQQDQTAASPHIHPQGYPAQYQTQMSQPRSESNQSSHSFDELLPPSALGRPDQTQAAYSHYGSRQTSGGGAGGGTLFAHQHSWGYSAGRDTFGPSHSALQQQNYGPGQHRHGGYHGRNGGPHMSPPGHDPRGAYYAATTPGPPIQTTPSNKGPDGANLFIFHIPNHFTNLDMYNLFCPYGNLLSVRIMVEKDTGRSRGFGFVSYDSPDSAAMAIKDLNGFVIGNKRLKVQHKQIRAGDHGGQQHHPNYNDSSPYGMPHHPTERRDIIHGGARDGSGPLSSWYGGSQAAGLELDDSSPSGGGTFSPEIQVVTSEPPFHPAKEGDGDNIEKSRQISTEASPLPSDENSHPLPPPPFSQEAPSSSTKVIGGKPQIRSAPSSSASSPLGHFESIRSALPDV